MIIVSGIIPDAPVRLLLEQLIRRGLDFIFMDHLEHPIETKMFLSLDESGQVSGYIQDAEGKRASASEITGVYVRFVDFESREYMAGLESWERGVVRSERNLALSTAYDALSCTVVNRVSSQMSNTCKPLQMEVARQYGLPTPQTIVTTDAHKARLFLERLGRPAIFKGLGGIRSIVRMVNDEDRARFDTIGNCPVMFQEYVPGVNVRVHVVGDRVFATRIFSDSIDYRYDPGRFEPVTLPGALEAACIGISRHLELELSGIDLIEDEGQYWFLEANPSPGYSFFELNSGDSISGALADLLQQAGG